MRSISDRPSCPSSTFPANVAAVDSLSVATEYVSESDVKNLSSSPPPATDNQISSEAGVSPSSPRRDRSR